MAILSHEVDSCEMDVQQLLTIPRQRAFAKWRTESTRMVWTPIPAQDAVVLNIFPPRSHVFWSMTDFTALRHAQGSFVDGLGQEQLKNFVASTIKKSPVIDAGDAACCYLGSIARRFGDTFAGDETILESDPRAHRHLVIVAPMHCRAALEKHFLSQLAMNHEQALRPCSEDQILVNRGQDDNYPWRNLLKMPVMRLSAADRQLALQQIVDLGDEPEQQFAAARLPMSYYVGVTTMNPIPFQDRRIYEECSRILKFRARVNARIATLSALDNDFYVLFPGNPGMDLDDFDEIRAILRPRLDAQPFVRDPVIVDF